MKDRLLKLALGGYFVSLAAYAFLSYAFVEPNLVLSSSETYWNFQQWMWQLYSRRVELTAFYLLIICLLFFFYFLSIRRIKTTKLQLSPRNTLLLILAVSIPCCFPITLCHTTFSIIFLMPELWSCMAKSARYKRAAICRGSMGEVYA